MEINDKHHAFARAVASGLSHKDAAIKAGYSEKTALQSGSRLKRNEDIQVLIEKYKQEHKSPKALIDTIEHHNKLCDVSGFDVEAAQERFYEDEGASSALDAIHTDDPLEFLIAAMQSSGLDDKSRLDAAKAALPYKHGKVGDKGKKETKADIAKEAAAKGGLSARLDNLRKVK